MSKFLRSCHSLLWIRQWLLAFCAAQWRSLRIFATCMSNLSKRASAIPSSQSRKRAPTTSLKIQFGSMKFAERKQRDAHTKAPGAENHNQLRRQLNYRRRNKACGAPREAKAPNRKLDPVLMLSRTQTCWRSVPRARAGLPHPNNFQTTRTTLSTRRGSLLRAQIYHTNLQICTYSRG